VPVTGAYPSPLVHAARDLAQVQLQALPRRWRHTIGVTRRAGELIPTLGGDDADTLIAAAWLHDIGYAAPVTDTGFPPLDGARYLDRLGWPPRITALVAHHCGAVYLAAALGLGADLDTYPGETTALSDALTYADQTTDPDGQRTSLDARLTHALRRSGTGSVYATAHPQRERYLRGIAQRVEDRLTRSTAPA
jgi:HD superfamily phosphodiesterase